MDSTILNVDTTHQDFHFVASSNDRRVPRLLWPPFESNPGVYSDSVCALQVLTLIAWKVLEGFAKVKDWSVELKY